MPCQIFVQIKSDMHIKVPWARKVAYQEQHILKTSFKMIKNEIFVKKNFVKS